MGGSMKLIISLITIFILAVHCITPTEAGSKVQFTIIYTNDVMGEVEPCG